MVIDTAYRLCGYIEYQPSVGGFVTPVFMHAGEYMIQVSTGQSRRKEWEALPEIYHSIVNLEIGQGKVRDTDSFVYGFKLKNNLKFSEGRQMSDYLLETILPQSGEFKQLVESFVANWAALEPIQEPLTKESVWQKCLEFVAAQSNAMPEIFGKNFEVIDFNDLVLTLKTDNKEVRSVFEKQFREQLQDYFLDAGAPIEIKFLEKEEIVDNLFLKSMPFIFLDGTTLHQQGSHIIRTSINRYQDFDNFIVTGSNRAAYDKAILFSELTHPRIFTIRGNAGTGKSHIAHSIAKKLTDDNAKVGVYTIFNPPGSDHISNEEFEQFIFDASPLDVVILDNADSINRETSTIRRLSRVIKAWQQEGKKIVISYRTSGAQNDINTELQDTSDQVILQDPTEKDKFSIIEFKSKAYNIKLSPYEIEKLSEDQDVKNLWDIQKGLVKSSLIKDLQPLNREFFLSHDIGHFSLLWSDFAKVKHVDQQGYFYLENKSKIHRSYAGILSHFITDVFLESHGKSPLKADLFKGYDTIFFSLDNLRPLFFENKTFRELVVNFMSDTINKGEKDK